MIVGRLGTAFLLLEFRLQVLQCGYRYHLLIRSTSIWKNQTLAGNGRMCRDPTAQSLSRFFPPFMLECSIWAPSERCCSRDLVVLLVFAGTVT